MDRRILLALSIVAVVVVGYLLFIMDEQYIMSDRRAESPLRFNDTRFNETGERPHFFILPPLPITAVFIILFLLLTPLILLYSNMQMQKKLAASSELLSKLISKSNGGKRRINEPSMGRELVARLLEPKEMAVIDRLIEKPKGILQTEVVAMPGMTKLKAHRVMERLKQKGIVTVQKEGRTNLIKLDARTRTILSGLE